MYHIGQKLCCVDDEMRVSLRKPGWFARFRRFVPLDHNLNKGDIYVVTGLRLVTCHATGRQVECVFVDGAYHFGHRWMPFPAFQFRAIVERQTSIAVFTEMLRTQTMPARD